MYHVRQKQITLSKRQYRARSWVVNSWIEINRERCESHLATMSNEWLIVGGQDTNCLCSQSEQAVRRLTNSFREIWEPWGTGFESPNCSKWDRCPVSSVAEASVIYQNDSIIQTQPHGIENLRDLVAIRHTEEHMEAQCVLQLNRHPTMIYSFNKQYEDICQYIIYKNITQ